VHMVYRSMYESYCVCVCLYNLRAGQGGLQAMRFKLLFVLLSSKLARNEHLGIKILDHIAMVPSKKYNGFLSRSRGHSSCWSVGRQKLSLCSLRSSTWSLGRFDTGDWPLKTFPWSYLTLSFSCSKQLRVDHPESSKYLLNLIEASTVYN